MSPWPAPERKTWRPRGGILSPTELRRALREHPGWKLSGQRLMREVRFKDFREALGCLEQIATEANDFGRHPDICLLDGNRVRVRVVNPHHAGVTVAELRLVARVDAALERYQLSSAPSLTDEVAAERLAGLDGHEHPLPA